MDGWRVRGIEADNDRVLQVKVRGRIMQGGSDMLVAIPAMSAEGRHHMEKNHEPQQQQQDGGQFMILGWR